ncbi:MAG TPA: CDP-alcohol phosphatidyltransferase family protein [Gemmatimonadales bacterium]|nr:CDP-alcohol phosphatidyltransferase family protein [Gemmatimonadales bacterium]
MRPQSALALKGASVEEWTDVHFFRPVGIHIARALAPTRVTADQVTVAGLVVGLVAGHLLYYPRVWINLAGVALFVASDFFDSADGQLARLRGTSTRLGRVLDGLSDTARFLNLYVHLFARLVIVQGWGWPALVLVGVAIWSHSLQGAAVDFVKNAFLDLGPGGGGETDLPEDLPGGEPGDGWARAARRLYRAYVRRQVMMFPVTYRTLQSVRRAGRGAAFAGRWAGRQAPLLPVLTLIATNIRFALLAAAVLARHVAWFLWTTAVPMNLVMIAVIFVHERNAAALERVRPDGAAEPTVAD